MAPLSSFTPTTSPRQSDVSFTSSHTFTSEKRFSPPTTAIPAHPSTSTISRDSQASSDDPYQLNNSHTLLTRFPESTSTTRLPKAPVFVHRDHRQLRYHRNKQSTSKPLTHISTHKRAPTTFSNRSAPSPYNEKRCVSDIHDSCQANKRSVYRATSKVSQSPRRETTNEAMMYPTDDHIPEWLPPEELHNWKPAPQYDPCVVEDEPSSRWATSLRHISNLCRKDRNPPCIRGSILEVQPPTLTERFGLGSFAGERRYANRDYRARNPGRGRENKHTKAMYDELHRHGPADRIFLPGEDIKELGRDDYVGFLVPSRDEKVSRPRRGWRRFLRRSRV